MSSFSGRVKPKTKAIAQGFIFLYHLLSALSVLYTLNPHITQEGLDEIGPSDLIERRDDGLDDSLLVSKCQVSARECIYIDFQVFIFSMAL